MALGRRGRSASWRARSDTTALFAEEVQSIRREAERSAPKNAELLISGSKVRALGGTTSLSATPTAPSLSLAGVWLVIPDLALGLPVLRALSLCACCRHYPGAAGAARVEHAPALEAISALPWIGASLPNWNTLTAGIAGFFRPNPLAFMGWHLPLAPDAAGYYSTAPLQTTLNELVDFSLIAKCTPRLTVGAAKLTAPPLPNFPRLRALALFGRRLAEHAEFHGVAGVQKPAQEPTFENGCVAQ